MRVREVADLVGISVRTLHHYDEIGLLVPDEITESGYRLYSQENLVRLQQILFFRELGFPLQRIKVILDNPTFDRIEALRLQKRALLEKRKRLDQMLMTIEKTLLHERGEVEMSNKERFSGFDFSQNPHEAEARKRWGDEIVDRSKDQVAKMSPDAQEIMARIWPRLAELREESPGSDAAQEAIGEWYRLLNENFGTYTPEVFKCLGQMYVDDERFTKNIDKYGQGLARFMAEAMAIFADRQ